MPRRYRDSRYIATTTRTNGAIVLGKTSITQSHTLSGLRGRTVKPLTMRGADTAALADTSRGGSINGIHAIYHDYSYWRIFTTS